MIRRTLFVMVIIGMLLSAFFACGKEQEKKSGEEVSQRQEEPSIDLPKIVGKDGASMVLIPAGEFEMGMDPAEIPQLVQWAKKYNHPDGFAFPPETETPRHSVYLDAFYMDVYEVTNAQYKRFMDATGHEKQKDWVERGNPEYSLPNQPVVGVSWHDAKAYAEWAGKRLPTEAEWEKAARGGLVGKRFPWGDEDPDAGGTYRANYTGSADGYIYTAPVGSFAPNGYGLYDMAGNVDELCADWYDKDYYASSPKRNPTGPDFTDLHVSGPNFDKRRVLRGGAWVFDPYLLRVTYRQNIDSMFGHRQAGFRCAGDFTP